MTFAEFVVALDATGRRCWSLDNIEDRWQLIIIQYRAGLGHTFRAVVGRDLASVLLTGATCTTFLPNDNVGKVIDVDAHQPLPPRRLYEDIV